MPTPPTESKEEKTKFYLPLSHSDIIEDTAQGLYQHALPTGALISIYDDHDGMGYYTNKAGNSQYKEALRSSRRPR